MPAIAYVLIAVLANVAGQTAIKTGVMKFPALSLGNILPVIFSPYVFGGLALYGVGSLFWIVALSKSDLSFAYPMLALGYIAILAVSYFWLGETVTPLRVLGVVLITLGIFFVARS